MLDIRFVRNTELLVEFEAKIKVDPKKTASSFHVVKLLGPATAAARAEVFGGCWRCGNW